MIIQRKAKSNNIYIIMQWSYAIACVVFMILPGNTVMALINNYEKSLNLENAKKYCPTYSRNRQDINRDKAIQYYLAYLNEFPSTINKTKVLSKIGMLYAQFTDREKGIKPDYEKAKYYFEKSLESDPNFICDETISARTNLYSLNGNPETRLDAGIKNIKWLDKISEDKIRQSLEKEILLQQPIHQIDPGIPDNIKEELIQRDKADYKKTKDSLIRNEMNIIKNEMKLVEKSQGQNIIFDAMSCSSPEIALNKIITELNGTNTAVLAREKLAKLSQNKVSPIAGNIVFERKSNVKSKENNLGDEIPKKDLSEAGHIVVNTLSPVSHNYIICLFIVIIGAIILFAIIVINRFYKKNRG